MSVKITKKENSKVELEFVVPSADFDIALDEAFRKNASKFKIAGFRNGKAPRNVIEKMYGEGVMYDEAFSIAADKVYLPAIMENNLEVVSAPEVESIKSIGKGKDLEFTIVVYVKPEVKVNKYKGLEVEKVNIEVTDEDVEHELSHVQDQNARMITKDGGAVEEGDIAVIDFEGFLNGVAFEGGKAEKYELTIGSHSFIPGFEEQIVGMKVEEEKDINVTFPEDYGNKDLAGNETVFKIKLHEIKKKELPVIDDEFAKDVSEFDNLADYKASIKEQVKQRKENMANAEKERKALDKLVEEVEVNIPDPMVDHETEHMLEDFKQNLAYQGLTMEKYLEMLNTDYDGLKEQFKPDAIKNIKLRLAFEYIIAEEKVEVNDEEVKARVEELSNNYGKDASSFMSNPNVIEYVKGQLKQEKVMKIVTDNVIEK